MIGRAIGLGMMLLALSISVLFLMFTAVEQDRELRIAALREEALLVVRRISSSISPNQVKQFYRREMTDIRTDMRAMVPVTIAFTLFGAYMYSFIHSIIPRETRLLGLLGLETDPNLVWLVLGLNSLLMVIGLSKAASTTYLEYRWMKGTLWCAIASFATFTALFVIINYAR